MILVQVLAMVLLAVAIPAVPTPPPPIIVTTKTSVLCNAVRTIVAPAVLGLIDQDFTIERGRGLVQDMVRMHSAGAEAWVELDTMRLGRLVDDVAQKNIKLHLMLSKLQDVSLKNPTEASELSSLRVRLLNIADTQAESLNLLSGTADTEALSELEGFQNPMAGSLQPDARPTAPSETIDTDEQSRAPAPPDSTYDISVKQSQTDHEELPILSLVRPIVERCR